MRKALLSVLLLLILILIILFMKNGLSIGSFQIYGFQDINQKNDELTQAINNAKAENDNYTSALSKLDSDVDTLTTAKKNYLDLIAQSSENDIKEATQTKTYTIEYLWSKIGNHATEEGVTLKMEVVSSTLSDQEYRNLNFTVDGEYLAIVQFIYDIENDSDLDFIVDSFDMTSKHATFTVKDVKIQRELSSSSGTTTSTEDNSSEVSTTAVDNAEENTENTDSNQDENTEE